MVFVRTGKKTCNKFSLIAYNLLTVPASLLGATAGRLLQRTTIASSAFFTVLLYHA